MTTIVIIAGLAAAASVAIKALAERGTTRRKDVLAIRRQNQLLRGRIATSVGRLELITDSLRSPRTSIDDRELIAQSIQELREVLVQTEGDGMPSIEK